ncbi:MAG: alpha/beta fold hydrolase [Chromatiales bacterium]|nr:alpha/beta fold hydrolase [Chromatiales bacterium]
MHGFPDSMHLYDRLVPLLVESRHIITFDFLGWGDSDKPEQHRYDVASLRRDLEAVIDHFSLNRVLNEEIERRQDRLPELKRLQTPVRIIFGNDDTDLNAGVAKDFHQLLPNSEIYLVENAGHFVQIDKPSVVASLIRDFPLFDGEEN